MDSGRLTMMQWMVLHKLDSMQGSGRWGVSLDIKALAYKPEDRIILPQPVSIAVKKSIYWGHVLRLQKSMLFLVALLLHAC